MLQLFRRPDDPKEYFNMFLLPAALLCGGVAAGSYFGLEQVRIQYDIVLDKGLGQALQMQLKRELIGNKSGWDI